jgi:outer membrane protein, heavy metal efflux system
VVTLARCLLLAAVYLALPGPLLAQPVLGPAEAVSRALAQPELLAAFDARIAEAEADLLQARQWSNPVLAIEREAGEPARGEPDETSILLSQQFALGSRRGMQRQAARLGIGAARAEIEARRAELAAEVLRDYYAAVTAMQRREALAAALDHYQRIGGVARSRRAAGDLSGFEEGRIAQRVRRAQLALDAADADLALAGAELAARIGAGPDAPQLPPAIEVIPTLPDADAARAGGGAALDALAAGREQAVAARVAAERWQLPVTVGVGQKRFDGPGARDAALVFELAVPLPLLDRNQADRQRALAAWQRADASHRLAIQQAGARRAAAERQLRQRIEGAREQRDELLPRARELARIAEASFAEGELDLAGLLAALDAEAEAVAEALDAALDARRSAIAFDLDYPLTPTGDLR